MLRVNEVAELARVSIRTLHHYHEVGLLVPSARSKSGYRLYREEDLLLLQQILVGRELGMPLEAIKRSLDDPSYDRRGALEGQRRELLARAERTAAMLRSVEAALLALQKEGETSMTIGMSDEEVKALFDGFEPSRYEAEAKSRWGETEAYEESKRRTSRYTKADWERYRMEADAIMADAAALMLDGTPPAGAEGTKLAERHRLSIDRWFYPCSRQMHRGLADMYEADARFRENIDRHGAGLTAWLVAAIRASNVRDESCEP